MHFYMYLQAGLESKKGGGGGTYLWRSSGSSLFTDYLFSLRSYVLSVELVNKGNWLAVIKR